MSLIDEQPRIGRYCVELAAEHKCIDFFPLDDAADLDRLPFFYPEKPEPGIGPFGQHMVSPAFRRYRHEALIAYEFADVHLIGSDGVVVLDNGVVRDSLDHVGFWHPDSNVAEIRGRDGVRLRRPMPVSNIVTDGRHAIGFSGAWRNYGHWLPQCLPKLYAFTLLRRRFRDMRVALPPLPPGSPQSRTLDLLGIGPEAVYTVPPDQVTCFATAILLPSFDIWTVPNFLPAAADALIARQPAPAAGSPPRSDKVYVHRTVASRNVANFAAVRPLLERYGFSVVSFEGMDLAEQVATMQAARHVICEHGAGTANIIFCRASTRVLELFSPFCVQPAYWSLASRRGLDYGYLVGTHSPTPEAPQPDWNAAYDVPLDRLEEAIRATLRLPPRAGAAPAASPTLSPTAQAAARAVASPPPAAPFPIRPGAPAGAAMEAPTAGFSGVLAPTFGTVNDLARFGRTGGHERLPIFAQAVPMPGLPLPAEPPLPPEFAQEHGYYPPPPAVAAYAIGGGVLWSTGIVTHGTQFVAPPDCLPSYFNDHFRVGAPPLHPIHGGALGRADVRTITMERPVAVATHPNLGYGHVVLEVLPRLWLLAVLREFGADIPLALSRTVPDWVKAFALMFHAEQQIVWYDGGNERLRAPSIVMPSMLHTEYNFHPAMNLMVRDLVQRVPPPDPAAPKLLYLAEANFGEELLENQQEIEQSMLRMGFAVVRLAALPPAHQVRLLAGARAVVAEQGYALHAALFAPPGTRVVALNFANHYQSAIARLRGHRIAYVPPADGRFRHWRLSRDLSRTWKIDIAQLQRVIQQMLQAAAP